MAEDENYQKPICKHCGGLVAIRSPRGDCDHLYWPDMLTDEAKIANGYVKVLVEKWMLAADAASAEAEHDLGDRR